MTEQFPHTSIPAGQEKRMQEWLAYSHSSTIARAMHAHPNTCFDNAWQLFLRVLPELFVPDGTFVEGWYVVELDDEVVLNEHGWCELADGTILDPTITQLPISPQQAVYYYPGVRRSPQEMSTLICLPDVWFPYVRCRETFGPDGFLHPAYKAAHAAAMQRMKALATATTPSKKQTQFTAQDIDVTSAEIEVVIILPDEREH